MFRNRTFKVLGNLILLVVLCTGQAAAAPNNSTNEAEGNPSAPNVLISVNNDLPLDPEFSRQILMPTGDTTREPVALDEVHGNNEARESSISTALSSSPMMFIENVGQPGDGERFQVRGSNGTIWLSEDALWITVQEKSLSSDPSSPRAEDGLNMLSSLSEKNAVMNEGNPREVVNIKVSFPGANPTPYLEPFNRLETHFSYFIGDDPAKWRADVPVWGGVRYKELYPGIDLEISGENGHLVQRLVVREDADLNAVQLRVDGADRMVLDGGLLRLTTKVGEYSLTLLQVSGAGSATLSYPAIAGNQVASPFAPTIQNRISQIANQSDLLYSTFLGGSSWDDVYDIAVDANGTVYVTGETFYSDFPTTPGVFDRNFNGYTDAFVVKLNPAGSALIYATFLGGSNDEYGSGIAIDSDGAAYITGGTTSSDFPTTTGAFDTSYNNGIYTDAFIAKLNSAGSALTYATFLGGSGNEWGRGIAIDSTGAAYVTSITSSSDFPTLAGAFDPSYNGGTYDAFVVKLNATGSALVYATFLGGSGNDFGADIVLDASGAAYVTGSTYSSDFPTTTGAFNPGFNGNSDVFAVKLNANGSGLTYATFLGGSGGDEGSGIAIDSDGAAYITGVTSSSDFPATLGAFDTSLNGNSDVFVAKLNAAGSALTFATFLGGSISESGRGIAVDSGGAVYVVGYTYSSDFPTTPGAFDTNHNGNDDAFVVKLNAAGLALAYATFLGGIYSDQGSAIAIDASGVVYITGHTASSDFPATSGAFDTSYNASEDAFMAKLVLADTPSWTFLLYLAGDNDLYFYLQRAITELEAQTTNPNVNIVVFFDGDRTDDSWRFLVQPNGNYTIGVNKWFLNEVNTGDPQTLSDFVTWTRENYPAQNYYLSIADHGRGTSGIAWDATSQNDYLTTSELRTALNTATNSGQWKIDVVHYDTCLMGMLEDAYQIQDYADYLVASENLGWSVFAYTNYTQSGGASAPAIDPPYEFAQVAAQVTAATTPRQLAIDIADAYFNHPSLQNYPRTIAALDLSQTVAVRQAVDTLAGALRVNLNSVKTYVQNTRSATQKFDSRDYYQITQDDEYVDLYHIAEKLKQYVPDASVQSAAQGVMVSITNGFVIAEHHQSGYWDGNPNVYWDLDNAHGISIYFPPRSGSNDYNAYIGHQKFRFTVDSQWDEFLLDYFGAVGLPPETGDDPGVPPMLSPMYIVYLPMIVH